MKKSRTTEENVKYWKSHVEAYRNSGLSQKKYCEQEKISYWSMNHWKRKIDPERNRLLEIPLSLVDSLSKSNKEIELTLEDRIRISIPERFSEDTLKKILNILGVSI